MDNAPMSFTTLSLVVLLVVMIFIFVCHFLGPHASTWMRSNKEEKIGLSKNKLFHANGYMIHSGSEFLLSTSGSFKRFDTVDKEDSSTAAAGSSHAAAQHTTTPLWNLPQAECDIPPQPLRPAPVPLSAGHAKTVTFSFDEVQNQTFADASNCSTAGSLSSCLRTSSTRTTNVVPQAIVAPPPPRLLSSSALALSSTAIPRPVAKRQISLQTGAVIASKNNKYDSTTTTADLRDNRNQTILKTITPSPTAAAATIVDCRQPPPPLTRRNSSTNPFLCESIESLPDNAQSSGQRSFINGNDINPFNNNATSRRHKNDSDVDAVALRESVVGTNGSSNGHDIESTKPTLQNQQFRNRSFSETEATESDLKTLSSKIATAGLQKLSHTTNPFAGLTQKVKGPHMLQKTISEDYLFRKFKMNHTNGHDATSTGNTTWSFGRSLLRQDSSLSLGRRNSSQCSLDSSGSSMEAINLEHATSCDSVNSELSMVICELDQPYTQITGYLCVGLQYEKNSLSEAGIELTVSVLEAKDLKCPFSVESLDTFVRIYLVPDQAGAMQTKIFNASQTPNYNESFNFCLKKQQGRHSLWFHLYHSGVAHTLIGEAEMEIAEIARPITTWIPLTDSRKCNAQWGELMFSLSYLPTAERLTIVVVKARNLKLDMRASRALPLELKNIFVKVYLMNNEKKVLKKRTSLKRKDRCPIFNESMIFSVPPQSLTTVQLRLTVFGVVDQSTITPLGHVIAGSCATGKGLRHWHQMLSSLRKPVAMWHVLRRATNQPIFTGGAAAVVAALQSTALRAKRNSII